MSLLTKAQLSIEQVKMNPHGSGVDFSHYEQVKQLPKLVLVPIDKKRFPGAQRCKHCGSHDVQKLSTSLNCRRCGRVTWRWP